MKSKKEKFLLLLKYVKKMSLSEEKYMEFLSEKYRHSFVTIYFVEGDNNKVLLDSWKGRLGGSSLPGGVSVRKNITLTNKIIEILYPCLLENAVDMAIAEVQEQMRDENSKRANRKISYLLGELDGYEEP